MELAVDNALTGFRQAVRQLTVAAPESLGALASETAFERLYHQLTVLPDGVTFNPLDRDTQSWPNLTPDDMTTDDAADRPAQTARKRAQAFYQRCIDAARHNQSNGKRYMHVVGTTYDTQATPLPRSSDAIPRDRNLLASKAAGSGKPQGKPRAAMREADNAGRATVGNAAYSPHGADFGSHGSQGGSAPTAPGTNTLHDVSVLLISSLGAIDRYADAVLTQRNTAASDSGRQPDRNAAGAIRGKTRQSDTVIGAVKAALHPPAQASKQHVSTASTQAPATSYRHPALLSAAACIAQLLERPEKDNARADKTRVVNAASLKPGVSGTAENTPAQLQPHTFSANVQNAAGADGNPAKHVVGSTSATASVPVPFSALGDVSSALEPDLLAEKVDQALREQAWLNGVDLS